jgi:hypothetical protein
VVEVDAEEDKEDADFFFFEEDPFFFFFLLDFLIDSLLFDNDSDFSESIVAFYKMHLSFKILKL